MKTTFKRKVLSVAAVHFVISVAIFLLSVSRISGAEMYENYKYDYIEYGAWNFFLNHAFLGLQPQFDFFIEIDWLWSYSHSGRLWINPIGLDHLVGFISIIFWSLCFGWLWAKLFGWLGRFPILGHKFF